MSAVLAAWDRFWFTPQPAHRLALFRIIAPLAILGLLSSRLLHWGEFFTATGFHVPELGPGRVQQPLYIEPISAPAALTVTVLLVAAGLCVSLGLFTRVANVIFAALLAYVALFDRVSAVSVNKLGTTVMVALCFCDSGAAYSLDALRRRRGGRPGEPQVNGAVVRFLQVQLGVMYCASALCKGGHGDWLKNNYVLWSQLHGHYQTAVAYHLARLMPAWGWPPLQWMVFSYELLAPALLLWRRTRNVTVGFGLCMHLMVALLFRRLIYFSVLMMSLLSLFLPDSVQLRILRVPQALPGLLRGPGLQQQA